MRSYSLSKWLGCVFCIIALIVCLTACTGNVPHETPPDSNLPTYETKSVEYDLSAYKIIRPIDCENSLKIFAVSARDKIKNYIDFELVVGSDYIRDNSVTDEIKNAKEILVGQTNREESAKALEKLTEDNTYIITVINNKIVINAKEDGVAAVGALYFADNIAANAEETRITLEEGYCYISEPVNKLVIADGEDPSPKIVYSEDLSDEKDASTNETDYIYDLSADFHKYMETLLDADILLGNDSAKNEMTYEILIGETERQGYNEFFYSLGYNEYGFEVRGGKLIIAGTNMAATNMAVESAKVFLNQLVTEREDGTKCLELYDGMGKTSFFNGWFVDIPELEGGKYIKTHDADNGELLIYFEETTPEIFSSYCDKLEADGFSLWGENSIDGNLYSTYTRDDGMVHISYTDYTDTIRIVTAKAGSYKLPENTEQPSYPKVTDTYITQLACDYTHAQNNMAYIITLEDGSFVLIDSGDDYTNFTQNIYNKLKKLNKRPDGKIVISGWFITHNHPDHYSSFLKFCNAYGKIVTIENLYINTTSPSYEFNTLGKGRALQEKMKELQANCGFELITVHTGLKFYIANAKIEIMHTEEDTFPQDLFYFNDTSIVWKMTMAGQTSLWTGDASDVSADIMVKKYPTALKSDMVQLAHHGYVGCSNIFYMKVNAGVLFWPTSQKGYDDMNRTSYKYYAANKAAENRAHTVLLANIDRTIKLPFYEGDSVTIG